MKVVVDTSALFATLDARDANHDRARAELERIVADGDELVVTNYVAVEALALVGRRLGMDGARALQLGALQAMDMLVTSILDHSTAVGDYLESGRSLSFVDCATMAVMRSRGLTTIFTFDDDFARAGFEVVPAG